MEKYCYNIEGSVRNFTNINSKKKIELISII